jgi:hypothetical protein
VLPEIKEFDCGHKQNDACEPILVTYVQLTDPKETSNAIELTALT